MHSMENKAGRLIKIHAVFFYYFLRAATFCNIYFEASRVQRGRFDRVQGYFILSSTSFSLTSCLSCRCATQLLFYSLFYLLSKFLYYLFFYLLSQLLFYLLLFLFFFLYFLLPLLETSFSLTFSFFALLWFLQTFYRIVLPGIIIIYSPSNLGICISHTSIPLLSPLSFSPSFPLSLCVLTSSRGAGDLVWAR